VRLLKLYLEDYRVLRQLDLKFSDLSQDDVTYTLSFLVGVNGSGKTTVLRALVDILRKLEQGQTPSFPFELEYLLGSDNETQHIHITHPTADYNQPLQIEVNEQPRQALGSTLLPDRVVVFTTGSEAEWEEQERRPSGEQEEVTATALRDLNLDRLQLAIQELPGKPLPREEEAAAEQEGAGSQQPARFLFIRAKQLPLLTLCGLLADVAAFEQPDQRLLKDVLQENRISFFRGFSLKFRMNRGTTDPADEDYVKRLKEAATRALRMGTDYVLFFDLTSADHARARDILAKGVSSTNALSESAQGLAFFEELARLYESKNHNPPILREVHLFLERAAERDPLTNEVKEAAPLLLLDWLSDGEQSFLGRMCLFSLLGKTESLILLDEPEVHFNDYWKRQIVALIDKVLRGRTSHALITTHSSITLTDARREDILVLDRGDVYTSTMFRPNIRTYAADPSDIIVSVFGAPQAAGAQSVNRIQEVLANRQNREQQREQLKRLREEVGPGYWSYRIRRELMAMGEQ
jgi:ABC-type cobalamin/Fe3+-siderophores transport system ATPase subunit